MRAILEAAGPDVIVVSPTGCLETFTSPYGYAAWGVPWLHVLFENAGAVASGVSAALKMRGLADKVKVVVIGGDGGTLDIGLGSFSGMLERGHDMLVHLLRQRSLHEHRRPALERHPLGRHDHHDPVRLGGVGQARAQEEPGRHRPGSRHPVRGDGLDRLPEGPAAQGQDRAVDPGPEVHRPAHAVPDRLGLRLRKHDRDGRLAVQSGLVPLYEVATRGPLKSRKINKRTTVVEYLRAQKRFRHLFEREDGEGHIDDIQAIADENIARYGMA